MQKRLKEGQIKACSVVDWIMKGPYILGHGYPTMFHTPSHRWGRNTGNNSPSRGQRSRRGKWISKTITICFPQLRKHDWSYWKRGGGRTVSELGPTTATPMPLMKFWFHSVRTMGESWSATLGPRRFDCLNFTKHVHSQSPPPFQSMSEIRTDCTVQRKHLNSITRDL